MNIKRTDGLLGLIAVLLAADLLANTAPLARASTEGAVVTNDVLRARLIELVAPDGKVVAQLHTADDGAANLRMRNGKGEARVELGATLQGAGLVLMNRNTEPAVTLSATEEVPVLTLSRPGHPSHVINP
jgi:hypothetical protein